MPENSLKALCWYGDKPEKQTRFRAVFERLTTFNLASGRPALLQRSIPYRQNKGPPWIDTRTATKATKNPA